MSTDRRTFLQLLSAGALTAALPPSIQRALALPARRRTGTIADVENIVILMQENRSFDHYFGTLRGVRGFGDPRAVKLPSGEPVWRQPNGSGYVLPFHPTAPALGLQFMEGTPHNWKDTHDAWNAGKYDRWVPSKGTTTMAYLTRDDIPFHYALADAFTICDAYHCSFMGATDPNRYHMWTGWAGNDGQGGGPVLDNAEAGYDWMTFPERLQSVGVSWKVYQDVGAGLDAAHSWGWGEPYIGNYGDNSLLYFHQYQNAADGSPLAERARTGTNVTVTGTLFDDFRRDALADKLPQVSWIVAPEAYSEHPNWPANYGAWYTSQILDALTANPDVWGKTAFFVMYDENDGLFDHVVPPTPPTSRAEGLSTVDTTNELFAGNAKFAAGPYGLGVRVPMLVISPWSRGGWVNSEVFDHTSLIRFIEQRFKHEHPSLIESNITKWRRAVAGDLTSAFDFRSGGEDDRRGNSKPSLPSVSGYAPPDQVTHPNYKPAVPTNQALPLQEPGVKPARAVPYRLNIHGEVDTIAKKLKLHFLNTGSAAAVFQVRSSASQQGPWTYTVGANAQLVDAWDFAGDAAGAYDLSVYGPNGFLRSFKAGHDASTHLDIASDLQADGGHGSSSSDDSRSIALSVRNLGNAPRTLTILDAYTGRRMVQLLKPQQAVSRRWTLHASYGWYDFTIQVEEDPDFTERLAGHVESACDSMTDPAIAAR